MRVLVAFDREYRAYGQFIAETIRRGRSHAKVETVDSGPLLEERCIVLALTWSSATESCPTTP